MIFDDLHTIASRQLNDYIRAHSLRHTHEREAMLQMVCMLPQPFTADELVEAAQQERITKATVYNFLQLLVQAQVLFRLDRQVGFSQSHYQLLTSDSSHMQVVCRRCGRVTRFRDVAIENLLQSRRYSNFLMRHYTLFVFGECKRCRKNITNH